MPKDTGIITDYKAHPDENDALRWMLDAHRSQWNRANMKGNIEMQAGYEWAMLILGNGLKRVFGVNVEYQECPLPPKYYRDSREYFK